MNKKPQIFTSKVNTLKYLETKLSKSIIEPFIDFTILEWKQNSTKILDSISKKFINQKIIIRSSAEGEDSFDESKAGNYLSVLNINSNNKNEVKKAINSVNKSYQKKYNFEQTNQIFAQKQTIDIKISGVVFTKAGNMGLPYYLINYDLGNSTTSVTSGKDTKTMVIFRNKNLNSLLKTWKNLLKAIKE
ncbi:MAG: PEP/pyruvate-binding domain-containing protein, partial [Candidatus Thorarchaeota archaeon]